MNEVISPEHRDQHENWRAANQRLWRGRPPAPQPKLAPKPTVVEQPIRKELEARWERLFTRAIEEEDDYGNLVVHPLFMPAWKHIAIEVAAKHGVRFIDLISARRDHAMVLARHEAFWRCKTETTMSLPQIGRRFGGRDHTTVIHGVRKHEERMKAAATR